MEDNQRKAASLLMIGLLAFGVAVAFVATAVPGVDAAGVRAGSDCDNPRDEEEGVIADDCDTHATPYAN